MIRAVIDQNELPLFVYLCEHRLHSFPEPRNWSVEHRQEDADKRLRGKFIHLISHLFKVARSGAMPLEPFLVFAGRNCALWLLARSGKLSIDCFCEFLLKTKPC